MKAKLLKIAPGGQITFIHSDALAPLMGAGQTEIRRASHVEPEPTSAGVKWFADLKPVNGPKLGPFDLRSQALEAEVDWLNENVLGGSHVPVSRDR